jgi:ComF family protein
LHQIARAATSRAGMGGWAAFAADLLLPRRCAACDTALSVGHPRALCAACWRSLPMPVATLCARCGIPCPSSVTTCAACLARPPAFDVARAVGLYLADGTHLNPLARAVRALKFRGHRAVAGTLGEALAGVLPRGPHDAVVPVPLHRARLRERGYNQAALLARGLARAARLVLVPDAIARRHPTPPQADLDAVARRANVRGAFVASPRMAGAAVVLVDDVLTTGATADACARALRAAGARRVSVLTVGRTP